MGSQSFNYVGHQEKFTVPHGVKILNVNLHGGGSGTAGAGRVVGKMRVSGGDVLYVLVGQAGKARNGNVGGGAAYGGGAAGGTGGSNYNGGRGGGGASSIRRNVWNGPLVAVAGGAGGSSGDGGAGGKGGGNVGGIGGTGNAGAGTTHHSTGGTQDQGGKGGTTGAGTALYGKDAANSKMGSGGKGASQPPNVYRIIGGGGGGGGYYPGGGGQAGVDGQYPAGGGAGGSNFSGGLYSVTSTQGNGGTDNGSVTITWEDPGGDTPPTPPTGITINGVAIADQLPTKATDHVWLKGKPDDPDAGQGVRIVAFVSKSSGFSSRAKFSGTYDKQGKQDVVQITGLVKNTLYYVRVYTQDQQGKLSPVYTSTSFWTDRPPDPPTLGVPSDNQQFPATQNMTFSWTHHDPDPSDGQSAFEFRYRRAGTPVIDPGEWKTTKKVVSNFNQWTIDAGTFKGNTFYEWQVRTWDQQDFAGEWAEPQSFYVTADATPPTLLDPVKNSAITVAEDYPFRWKFLTPVQQVTQTKADIQWRIVGQTTWNLISGDTANPGAVASYMVPGGTFTPGYRYEWQARTYSSASTVSDWSDSAYFWAVNTPGLSADPGIIDTGQPSPPLGQGINRAFVYDRGGKVMRGEITPLADIQWGRARDDLSGVMLHIDEWDADGKAFLGSLRSWAHEIVVFRDGERVWEGPITRISADKNGVEIEAKDVMAYVYRRIMRQGYDDSYRLVNGEQLGLKSVVVRSAQIIMNALAYDDPNVLPYLTTLAFDNDARTSRVVKDYAKTAWEEVDDLAATAGLDYVTIGRRIVLFDTHTPLGRLPEFRDGDFSAPPVVTEYGMNGANYFAVTNGDGVWGAVASDDIDPDTGQPGPTGYLEQLASAYGESQGASADASQTLTRAALRELRSTFEKQAIRNIGGRWPVPLVVRIPDNSTLSPELNIGINQLVPGVWLPLRASSTIRDVSQWQKLDSMTVSQDSSGEKISVVLSPAPNGGQDPDSDAAATTQEG